MMRAADPLSVSAAPRAAARTNFPGLRRLGYVALTLGVVLLVSAPGGSSSVVPRTFKAPYSITSVLSTTNPALSGCGKLHDVPAVFNVTTGIGNFSAKASATSCEKKRGGPSVESAAGAAAQTYLILPVGSPLTGVATVALRVNMTLRATTSNNFSIDWKCPPAHRNRTARGLVSSDCTASSAVLLTLRVVVLDMTTYGQILPANMVIGYSEVTTIYADDNCYSYGCWWSNYSYSYSSGTLAGNLSWFFNTSLISSNNYSVAVTVGTNVNVEVQGFPKSEITAAFNDGTKGNYWNLTSISEH
jgi:hypothetical protein